MKCVYNSLFCVVIILFSSCHNNQTDPVRIPGNKSLVDSFILNNVSDYFNCIHFSTNNGKIVIYYVSSRKDKIYTMDESKNITDSIMFSDILKGQYFDYYVEDSKLFYVLLSDENIIYKFNDSNLIGKYKYYTSLMAPHIILSSFFFDFEISKNKTILNKIKGYRIFIDSERKMYFDSKLMSVFKLENDSIIEEKSFLKFPEAYKNEYYGDLFPIICRIGNDSIVSVFSNSNLLYKYDLQSDTQFQYTIDGVRPINLSHFSKDSIQSLPYSTEYEIKNDKFVKILYDKISHDIAIFQILKIDKLDDGKGQKKIYKDKPVLISIIDSNSHVRKQIYFPDQGNNLLAESYFYNSKLYIPEFTKKMSNKIHVYEAK